MSEQEYAELRADIEANGQHTPIVVYGGQVLDGRHRLRACEELGLMPRTEAYAGREPLQFVLSMNLHRRHLSTAQKAEIARQALPHLREQAKERQRDHGGTAPGRSANTSGPASGTCCGARATSR